VQVYNAFDFVAGEIGEKAATGLILSTLDTLNLTQAFAHILFNLCMIDPRTSSGFVWRLPKKSKCKLRNASIDEACDSFSNAIDFLDPDSYGKSILLKQIVNLVKASPAPDTSLLSGYSNFKDKLILLEIPNEVENRNNIYILLEAISQQVKKGIGLLCPFFGYSPNSCCSSRNRAVLEQVWKRTLPGFV